MAHYKDDPRSTNKVPWLYVIGAGLWASLAVWLIEHGVPPYIEAGIAAGVIVLSLCPGWWQK